MKPLIVIIGPTASGKSQLALHLAQRFNGEIVSADSRQVYRLMDIGTAKPSRAEMSLIPHHLSDIINPDEDFSLAQYQELAYKMIDDVASRGCLPILAGGSGLYVWSVLEGWQIPLVPPDLEFRRTLEERASGLGGKYQLYQELVKLDPAAAQRNVRRTIRALEVHSGAQPSLHPHKKPPPFYTLIIGLTAERKELYRRIDERVERMIEQGLVAEVEMLVKKGYGFTLPSMSGIGYKQIGMFLRGELTLEAASQKIKTETHRFVRHQYNWFRLKDPRIRWFDVKDSPEQEIAALLEQFIKKPNGE